MTAATIQRYQPGGDIYSRILQEYGAVAADKLAKAAASGDPYAVNETLTEIRSGPRLPESTLRILGVQLATAPLDAPLESANRQIGTAVLGVFKNPWVLFALAVFVFLQLGGFEWLKKNAFAK